MPLKNDYSLIDREHGETPYVLPPFPCGWYEHTGQYGEKTVYQFRRMPRAGRYTGKYGLWLKDKDAGMVLIGVVVQQKLDPPPGTAMYNRQLSIFSLMQRGEWYEEGTLELTKRACSWCGRQLLDDTRLCHDKPMCTPGGIKKGKVT